MIIAMFAFIAALFSTQTAQITHRINAIASCLIYPVVRIQHTLARPIISLANFWHGLREARAKNIELTTHYSTLLAAYAALHEKSTVLQAQHQCNADAADASLIPPSAHLVQIIQKNYGDSGHFFIIDAGSRKGVREDMVVVFKNCLIGRVVNVTPFFSKVILISDRNCKVVAQCVHTGSAAVYEGMHTCDQAQLTHVSHLSPVQIDDIVVSSGEGLVFPRGFILGRVSSDRIEGVTHVVGVSPVIDSSTLDYCYVIQKGDAQER